MLRVGFALFGVAVLAASNASYADSIDWKAYSTACVQAAEGKGIKLGWQEVVRCIGQLTHPSDQQAQRLDWCTQVVAEKRAASKAPAATGGTAIEQTLRCARIIQ